MQLALQLLAIGMITVFLILFLVVQTARILIRVVNRYWPGEPSPLLAGTPSGSDPPKNIDPKIVAAISGVVSHLTEGKGTVKNIKRKEK